MNKIPAQYVEKIIKLDLKKFSNVQNSQNDKSMEFWLHDMSALKHLLKKQRRNRDFKLDDSVRLQNLLYKLAYDTDQILRPRGFGSDPVIKLLDDAAKETIAIRSGAAIDLMEKNLLDKTLEDKISAFAKKKINKTIPISKQFQNEFTQQWIQGFAFLKKQAGRFSSLNKEERYEFYLQLEALECSSAEISDKMHRTFIQRNSKNSSAPLADNKYISQEEFAALQDELSGMYDLFSLEQAREDISSVKQFAMGRLKLDFKKEHVSNIMDKRNNFHEIANLSESITQIKMIEPKSIEKLKNAVDNSWITAYKNVLDVSENLFSNLLTESTRMQVIGNLQILHDGIKKFEIKDSNITNKVNKAFNLINNTEAHKQYLTNKQSNLFKLKLKVLNDARVARSLISGTLPGLEKSMSVQAVTDKQSEDYTKFSEWFLSYQLLVSFANEKEMVYDASSQEYTVNKIDSLLETALDAKHAYTELMRIDNQADKAAERFDTIITGLKATKERLSNDEVIENSELREYASDDSVEQHENYSGTMVYKDNKTDSMTQEGMTNDSGTMVRTHQTKDNKSDTSDTFRHFKESFLDQRDKIAETKDKSAKDNGISLRKG